MPAHLIAEDGPLRGLVLNFKEGERWIIGRDPDEVDFTLEDSMVSRKHAQLTKTAEGILLENLSEMNPTLINNEEVNEPTLLKEGDRVKIGNTFFLYSEEEVPSLGTSSASKGKYDDIFGDLDPLPPEPEPIKDTPEETETEDSGKREYHSAYDTIFEDLETESDSEAPFDLSANAPFLLKVIGGPNAGAEIGLEKGRSYAIGKDANVNDIVFQDLSVSRTHARLFVREDGVIEIENLQSKNGTLVNGRAITDSQILTPQDLVSLGTTVFFIIDREHVQETIFSPAVPFYTAASTPSNEEAVSSSAEEEWKKRPIPARYLVVGTLLVATFFIAFLSFFSLFKAETIEVSYKGSKELIEEALSKYPNVQFAFNPASGKLFLAGHVLTAIDYQEMNYYLDQIPAITHREVNVVIDQYTSQSMNELLSENPNWRGVNLSSPEAGKFIAAGYVQTSEAATELFEYLTVNFPYLDRLENRVVIEENLQKQIESQLQGQGIGSISFQITNGELVITGHYGESQSKAYKALLETFNQLPGVQSIKDYATPMANSQAGIDISSQYRITGNATHDDQGFSVVINNRIYTVGDFLDSRRITEIEPNTILLEKDGVKYKIEYAR